MLRSVSAAKSGSRWLDRLRTAKGFPEDGGADLENFLQTPNSPQPERLKPNPNPIPNPDINPVQNEDKQLFSIMSDVLHELFNFGDTNRNDSIKLKKGVRKQANPRICAISSNCSDQSDNVGSEKASRRDSGVGEVKEMGNEGVEDVRDGNLSGFSRTEVTVIDTSYEVWKSDKMLYRKKNVWKVRDKKGKSEIVRSKKKRKVEEDRVEGKKVKVDEKKGFGEEFELPLNEVAYHQNDKSEAHEKAPDKLGKVPKKKQADFELENGSSSVILIKNIPTSKKLGTSISKSCLKPKQIKPREKSSI